MTLYTYTLEDFKNSKVNSNDLTTEINNSSITIALSRIDVKGDVLVYFKADLNTKDESLLDTIVANHEGNVSIPETVSVKIKEEEYTGETQGHFQSVVIDLSTFGNEIVTKDMSFPYPISLFSAEWLVDERHLGDRAEFHLGPDTIVGAIAENINAEDDVVTFSVSSSVTENVKRGFHLKIASPANECLGRVVEVDKVNNTITLEEPIPFDYVAGNYVFMTVKIVPHWRFTSPGFNSVGESKVGSSFIPANTVLRIKYFNENDVSVNKLFGISIDYMY